MIFVTYGTQLPFPRLVEMVREATEGMEEQIVVQPESEMCQQDYADMFSKARVVVAHAGVGTLIDALHYQKPLIVVPRRGHLGEQRDDHQMDSAEFMQQRHLAQVVQSATEMRTCLQQEGQLWTNVMPRHDELSKAVADLIGTKRVLGVASYGGHLVELKEILPSSVDATIVTTGGGMGLQIENFSRWNILILIKDCFRLRKIVRQVRPDIILTTGAAPGFAAIVVGRIMGIETIWVDSLSSAHRLSLSGRMARYWASQVYTQWPMLAERKVKYIGSILN